MAEHAVSSALVLIEIVIPLLEKLNLQEDAYGNLQSMKSWLRSIKAFIEDHSGHEGGSRSLEDQVDKVRDIAYDIEDVLDEVVLHSPPYTFHNHGITRKAHTFAHHFYHGFPHRGISTKITKIKKSIDDIGSQLTIFSNISESNSKPSSSTSRIRIQQPVVSPLLLDDEMVGYEKQKKELIRHLLDGETRLVTLAVAGPGGSGKTTFVKNVFWKPRIRRKFEYHAWVHVSQHFNADELFTNMLKQLGFSRKEQYPSDDGSTAQAKLHAYLAGKRFIVVLDDIWRKEDLDFISGGFPNAFCGSRVIFTTRYSRVASTCASSSHHIHNVSGLEWLQGWTLFCRKAFPDSNGECPSELKDCSNKILARCEGLPLAIVAVGGALSQKPRLPNEWERFHNNIGSEIRSDSSLAVISNALLPSYMDLSTNLKSCFLYFSIFPEDYSVERGRLIRLWVAERFAIRTDGLTAEEIAEYYLNELIQRNLVLVSNLDFDGRPRSCRVLNLVLKFIIQKCKDENFASIFPREDTSLSHKIRRLCVHNHFDHLPRGNDLSGVRSMFLLRLLEMPSPVLEEHLGKLKLVSVLDFQGAPLTEFPNDIARFTILRHLNFRGTMIKTIPSSIKKLSYLETLDLKQTDVTEIPKAISHLHNLRHLFAYKCNVKNNVFSDLARGVKVLWDGIGKLTNLQDMSLVNVDQNGGMLKDLKKLTKLRKLGLSGLRMGHGKELCASIEHMPNLTTLDLCSNHKEGCVELGEMSKHPKTLQRLYLKGRLNRLPTWIPSLDNLVRISLKWSKMECSPLEGLGKLKNLMELQMVDCCVGAELIFDASSFKKLRILLIEDFSKLDEIVIGDGAMRVVKRISLRKCPMLTNLPLGIHSLTMVEELTLHDMAPEFITRLRENGEDRAAVRRIAVIHSYTLQNEVWSFENLSGSYSH